MIAEDKIFKIKKAKFYLPHYPIDCISSVMVRTGNYWDNWQGGALAIIDKYLPENATILDIGANIGSHTIYWALERKAKKIYSFEPLPDTFAILKTNIVLNDLQNKVEIFNIGLSDVECTTNISNYHESNIGGTSFAKTNNGKFHFKSLDSLNIKDKIDLIKIDVEGAEVEVLQGAINTIKQSKSVIVLETFTHKTEVDAFLSGIGYTQVDTIRKGEDYIYKILK